MNENDFSVRDLTERLRESIRSAERAHGLDWRINYSDVYPADVSEVVAELSSEKAYDDLAREAGGAAQRVDRTTTTWIDSSSRLRVRLSLLLPALDRILWVATSVADIRRAPAHAAELINQLIMGEQAHSLKREGEWNLVRLPDGYHGWIHSWSFVEVDREVALRYDDRINARVRARVAYVLSEPRSDAIPLSDVVSGTKLVAGRDTGVFREVMLPVAKKGFMIADDLEPLPNPPATRPGLLARAMRFIGIPYLWGGTSAKAFDCSGFVKRIFQLEGIELPRDSDLQAKIGALIARERLEEIRPGDLLFFGEGAAVKHVAIATERGRFIHAYGLVRVSSLDVNDVDYDDKLAKSLLFGRSIFGIER